MSRKFFAVLPLAVLVMLTFRATAGPAKKVQGRMVFVDAVADALHRFRAESSESSRSERLIQLAEMGSRDPRVAIAIWEAFAGSSGQLHAVAADLVGMHYLPAARGVTEEMVKQWWRANETEYRRRAKLLP